MNMSHPPGGARRRFESLAARQARVGIVANPNQVALQKPLLRDVWTRWPDLRAANRQKAKQAQVAPEVESGAALDAFVRSVRRSAPVPDRWEEAEEPAEPNPDRSGTGGRLGVYRWGGVALFLATALIWFGVSTGTP